MAYLWGGMILLGILYATFAGNLHMVTESVLESSREAIQLCITMAGITALWTGIMKIAEKSGIVSKLSCVLHPFIHFLFPQLPKESKACHYISLNFLSNFLGLSWASTSSGLLAFQELDRINREECKKFGESKKRAPHIASSAMCTFLIMNVSSLQLVPMSIIAYRAEYGSLKPAAVAGPAVLATGISTLAAVIFCKIINRREGI